MVIYLMKAGLYSRYIAYFVRFYSKYKTEINDDDQMSIKEQTIY